MARFRLIFVSLLLLHRLPALAQNNAAEQSSVNDDSGLCKRLFASTIQAYQDLSHRLGNLNKLNMNSPVSAFIAMRSEDCNQIGSMARIEQALSQHSGKIAILLPSAGFPAATHRDLSQQLETWLQNRGIQSNRLIIWRDSGGTREKLEAQLAQLVFQEQVAIIIGGLYQQEAPILAQWANRLRIPAIILNRKPEGPAAKYVFYVSPDYKQLASAMTRFALERRLKHIAILEPQFSPDQSLLIAFQNQAKHLQIDIKGPLIYSPNDFNTMDDMLRKLFHIDDEARKEELLDLIRERRLLAQEQGENFDASKIMLPPIVDVDAIIIADHFKNVRHLSKALAYYAVKKIQLIGIPRWRALEIIDPPDPNLNGAVFVDYMGSYNQMPYGIQVPLVKSEFFTDSTQAGLADLKLLVHHAVFSALQALAGKPAARYALFRRLETIPGPHQGFLNFPQTFRPDHVAFWPSFLFGIGGTSLSLLQTWNPAPTAPTAAISAGNASDSSR